MKPHRFARQELIEGWSQADIAKARVLVVGAGTTGNEVIKNLALLGFGHLTIIDLDDVEEVNLSRSVLYRPTDLGKPKAITAAAMAQELNPGTEADGIVANVICGVGNLEYKNFHCVVLTVDNLEARMWVNRYCWLCETPLVDTGVSGLDGNVSVYFPRETSCLECSWSKAHYDQIAEKFSCLKVGLDSIEPKIPMVITSAAVIGGIAAQEVVRVVSDSADRSNRYIKYSGETRAWMTFTVPYTDSCAGHSSVEIPGDRALVRRVHIDETVGSYCRILRAETGAGIVQIRIDKEIVDRVSCRNCSNVQEIPPTWLTEFRRTSCELCGGPATPFEPRLTLPEQGTFKEHGIPNNHLLPVLLEVDDKLYEEWIHLRS